MSDSTAAGQVDHKRYARPVFFVSNLQVALGFYLDGWGDAAIQINDPDGNELLFPLDETNDRERQQ